MPEQRTLYTDKWEWQANKLQISFMSSMVDAARTYEIRAYVDALDECGEDVAIDPVNYSRRFAAPVPICFSYRHYPFVTLEGGNAICVEENEQDIEVYFQDKIDSYIQQTDIAKSIRNEVVSRSQRNNFQWVVLVLVMPRVLKV